MTRIRKRLRLFLSALVLAAPSSAFAADETCEVCKNHATALSAISGAHGDIRICDDCAARHVSNDARTISVMTASKTRLSAKIGKGIQ